MNTQQVLDYTPVLNTLRSADLEFTETYGCGAHYSLFDEHLKSTVATYNEQHSTNFDPFEALHLYLEQCEGQPGPTVLKGIDVPIDSLELAKITKPSIH